MTTWRTAPLVTVVALATTLGVLVPRRAGARDATFAGSAQADYHLVATARGANANAGTGGTFDGFTVETSIKVAADLSDHVSANVKLCYGCHGFEADMAYFDLRAVDELNVRVGRFSPSFGSFNLRHDPANHKLSDKPLPYDMGRMLRRSEWNNGVLPSPFPDNGAEVNGAHWFGDVVQLDYAGYATMGFKQDTDTEIDLDFRQSHSPYYVDNNGRPTLGGRVSLTLRLSPGSDLTLGASGMYGSYDPKNELSYAIVGGDLSFRFGRTNLRVEYLARRQEFDTHIPALFKYEVAPNRGDFFVKHGGYVELEQPLTHTLDLLGRVDAMYRAGNVPVASELSNSASVLRETLGLAYAAKT
ncbi:MAG: hypothetical protein JWM74_5952, partial [Myxococcaceae bacterium]|nr:hypothetical protein [Myxococcaceae bacterium]